jgi:23S rRNA pseudouridine2605 synthase
MTRQRLHKLMAACGIGSRRACEELITQGRVQVDGRTVTELGTQVDEDLNEVRCDGQLLRPEPQLYYLLHKPRGAICSMTSMPGKPRAVDFLPQRARDRRLFTIGRLDVDSEGAIILTNDGELCHLVSHPRFGVHKLYRVEVEGVPDDATIETMRKGVWLSEGRTGPVDIEVVHRFRDRTVLAIALQEGRKREIRRLCARFGYEVKHLTRMSIGPIELGELRPGEVRPLHPSEVEALRRSAQAVIRLGGMPARTGRIVPPKTGRGAGVTVPIAEPLPPRRPRGAGERPAGRAKGVVAGVGKGRKDHPATQRPARGKPGRRGAARRSGTRGGPREQRGGGGQRGRSRPR